MYVQHIAQRTDLSNHVKFVKNLRQCTHEYKVFAFISHNYFYLDDTPFNIFGFWSAKGIVCGLRRNKHM